MNSQMTLLALAGKCVALGAMGLMGSAVAASAESVSNPCDSSIAASANRPAPDPARVRNSRREG